MVFYYDFSDITEWRNILSTDIHWTEIKSKIEV